MLQIIGLSMPFLAALSATYFYPRYKKTQLKYFLPFIWYVAINDAFISRIYTYYVPENNAIVYNIYRLALFLFLFWLVRQFLIFKQRKTIVLIFSVVYILIFAINAFFESVITGYFRIPYIAGCILFVISALYYGIDLLKRDKIDRFRYNPVLWICTAYTIYAVSYPIIYLAKIIQFTPKLSSGYYSLLYYLQFGIVVIMYLLISLSFRLIKKDSENRSWANN